MKSKIVILIIVIIAIAVGVTAYLSHRGGNPETGAETISGTVKYVETGAETITVTTTDNQEITLVLNPKTKLYDESGDAINLTDIGQNMSIQAVGTSTTPTSIIPSEIKIVSRPAQGDDLAGPCPGVITEENNSITCRMSTTSRITISLPSADYSKGDLTISPSSAMGETFGASSGPNRWVRTFEAVQNGNVTITVPSQDPSVSSFQANITIYGAPATSTDDDSGTGSSDDSNDSVFEGSDTGADAF